MSGARREVMNVRLLVPGDESALETFLSLHRDSSMFLRGNARRSGLVYRGRHGEATYVAAVDGGRITGVVAHCWNGMILVQAPGQVTEVARACVGESGRKVTGLAGPREQVQQARLALGLERAATAMDGGEGLYALDIADLVVPGALATRRIECRPPLPEERDLLRAWRLAYDIELLGATDTPEARQRSAEFLDNQIDEGNAWVAIDNGAPVSLSAFNATLPDIVQLGGIYTPPELRGRGYARAACAASLLVARGRGASRAVLFTDNPSAVRTYEALGFRRIGDYALVLFQ